MANNIPIPSPLFTGNMVRDVNNIFKELERKKAEKKQAPVAIVPQQTIPITQSPNIPLPPQKKSGWGLAFLLVGTGVFVFWGIPLLQGKGAYKPGMSKPPPGYVPTRKSPGESEE